MEEDEVVDVRGKELARLGKELEKASAAGEFVNSKGGQNLIDWLQIQVNINTNSLLGDKFINDHNGYLDARAKVQVCRNIIAQLQSLSNPDLEAGLRNKIEEASSDG